jgi:hypothetical protein
MTCAHVLPEASAIALAPVKCETHAKVNALSPHFLRGLRLDFVTLNFRNVEFPRTLAAVRIPGDDLVHEIPHDTLDVGSVDVAERVLVLGSFCGGTVHVELLERCR